MSEKKEQVSVDQLLNSLVFQTKFEDIPFEQIRNSEAVQKHLKELVTRAYLDRNYTRQQTKDVFDRVIIAIIERLLNAEPLDEKEAPVQKEAPTDSAEERPADFETPEKRPPIVTQESECPAEVIEQINQQVNRFKRQRLASVAEAAPEPQQLFGDDSSSDESEAEILKQAAGETATEEKLSLPEVIEIE